MDDVCSNCFTMRVLSAVVICVGSGFENVGKFVNLPFAGPSSPQPSLVCLIFPTIDLVSSGSDLHAFWLASSCAKRNSKKWSGLFILNFFYCFKS